MQNNNTISVPESGMNRDVHPSKLQESEYSFALNATIESNDGNVNSKQNEPSNLLCKRFDDYKVVGYINDFNADLIYFFLANPKNKTSKITSLHSLEYISSVEDIQQGEGSSVDVIRLLANPLETSADRYNEICASMQIVIEDDEDDPCIGFSLSHPIKTIEIKDEKCGKTIYWTDGFNPPRYLNLKKLEEGWYNYYGEIICGDDKELEYVTFACEKLRIFPLLEVPCIEVEAVQDGGNLRAGTYEFAVALSDGNGNEISSYSSLTNPVHIFDNKDRVIRDGIWGRNTGYGIRLTVRNIDESVSHYKVAVIQRTVGYNGEVQTAEDYFIEGEHPITEKTVLYTTDQNKIRTSLPHLAVQKPVYKTSEGITSAANSLIHYGMTTENEWNLQPIANLLGSFLYWQTSYAQEDLYESPEATSKYTSYMRDEVYPFSFLLRTDTGYTTPLFPFIPRPGYDNEIQQIVDDNGNVTDSRYETEVKSILENVQNCSKLSRNKYWQFYNTATEIGDVPDSEHINIEDCVNTITTRERRTLDYPYAHYGNGNFSLEVDAKEDDEIVNLINDNLDNLCDSDLTGVTDICDILAGNGKPQYLLPRPEIVFPDGCETPEHSKDEDSITMSEIDISRYSLHYKDLEDYSKSNKATLSSYRSEANNQYTILFEDLDPDIISNDDNDDCNGYSVYKAIADNLKIMQVNDCVEACSCSTPLIDPAIGDYNFPSLEVQRYVGRRRIEYNETSNNSGSDRNWSGAVMGVLESYLTSLAVDDELYRSVTFGPDYNTGVRTNMSITSGAERLQKPNGAPGEARANATYRYFHPYLTRGAVWARINRPKEWKANWSGNYSDGEFLVLEFGGYNAYGDDEIGKSTSENVRITFYEDCQGTLHSNPLAGGDKTGFITGFRSAHITRLTANDFKDSNGNQLDRLYIAVDSEIVIIYSSYASKDCSRTSTAHTIMTCENPGKYLVGIRKKEINQVDVFFNSIDFNIIEAYYSNCRTCADKISSCGASPYKYGEFSYWESTEKYPANKDLYDSTSIKIDKSKVSEEVFNRLNKLYNLEAGEDGFYYPKNANFCQQNIRHYKFPDNNIAPFMNTNTLSVNMASTIYPIGVFMDKEILKQLLDVAVDNELITQEQRESVVSFEIWRGDRKLNKSVVSTGLAFDMIESVDSAGNKNLHANYPYNDLGEDVYIYADANRSDYVEHPYNRSGNCRYTLHSPDYHFNYPNLPVECKIEGYQAGYSVGSFPELINHPKWIILGSKAESRASAYARLETLAAIWAQVADIFSHVSDMLYFGLTVGAAGAAAAAVYVTPAIININNNEHVQFGLRRYEWLKIFQNNGQLRNFGYYYTSTGLYNTFIHNNQQGSLIRGISVCRRLPKQKVSITDPGNNAEQFYINNRDRENSLFLSFGIGRNISYESYIRTYDSSRISDTCSRSTEEDNKTDTFNNPEQTARILSPYMRLKYYSPNQYGNIDNVVWVGTGDCNYLNDDSRYVNTFGGDTYISRLSVIRPMSFFWNTAFGLENMIPFLYNDYRNVGYPRYYVNFDTGDDEFTYSGNSYPTKLSIYNLNCSRGNFYVSGKFYLYSYGIPQFLVESEINCNNRIVESPSIKDAYYPYYGDYVELTQQKNVPITTPEKFSYHPVFNEIKHRLGWRILPANYDKEFYDCAYQKPNGSVWSESDVSENSLVDPWLIYKPLNYKEFDTKNGKLIHMKGIESEQVLARFENQVSLLNAIDVLRERITPENQELGTGGLFASRPLDYNTTDLGYAGTQTTEIISTEFGHFWPDVKRGQMFMTLPNGRELKEVTPGLRNWLKQHLSFKILRSGITNVNTGDPITYKDVDNKFAGLGVSLGYDNRFKRIFITKKDYIPTQNTALYKYDDGVFYYNNNEISLTNTNYFKDVSFTLAYNPMKGENGEWISYYSFKPDYYIHHMNYFQTGINFSSDSNELGLWSHLLTNQSYQVFYGKLYPFIVEVPVKEEYINKILSNVKYKMDARRYQNEIDYAVNRLTGFNKMWLYNDLNNSGELRLVPEEKNNIYQRVQYPKVDRNEMHRTILATEVDGFWKINDFFNHVKNDLNNIPIWLKDVNDIMRTINPDSIYYDGIWNNRLRGDWFLMRLQNDEESRFKLIVGWTFGEEKVYNS